ncbi:ATP-binding protein [Streptomyces sp. NPDC048650]|uniref:ATP-binding protein n=1 Tax=unclassified Streptomyces TaxID=2593676 RepID=UPI003713A2EE
MRTARTAQTVTAPTTLHVALECRPETPRTARHLAGAFLHGLDPALDQDAAEVVVLVISELVTNAVRHSGGRACALRLSACSEAIAVAVSDESHVLPRPREADIAGEGGGFGWSMVCRMATAVAVTEEPEGKTINAVIPRQPLN